MFTIVGYVVRSPIFFFFLIGDLIEIGLRSAVFLPLISLQKGLKFASHAILSIWIVRGDACFVRYYLLR